VEEGKRGNQRVIVGPSAAAGGGDGIRSVAFILISQFYAFRHVITKRLELNTVLRWLSISIFIQSFFCTSKLDQELKGLTQTHMVISFACVFRYGRTEMHCV
jgi:hypothetical protein